MSFDAHLLPVRKPQCKTPYEGIMGVYLNSKGEVVSFIQCNCSDEAIIARMEVDLYPDDERFEEELRRLQRQDGYHVRRELGDNLINLGLRVNKIPSRIRRRF